MTSNEWYETEISGLVDGELGQREVIAVVDHLVEEPASRDFYRGARQLDLLLETVQQSVADGELPEDLWRRIETAAAGEPDAAQARRPAIRAGHRRVLQIAAVALLAVGAWALGRLWPQAAPVPEQVVQVRLESDGGRMTEDRFVALAAELLRADRRYHLTMHEILTALDSRAYADEGGAGEAGGLTESSSGFRTAALVESGSGELEPQIWH
jgi:hypothetical protein